MIRWGWIKILGVSVVAFNDASRGVQVEAGGGFNDIFHGSASRTLNRTTTHSTGWVSRVAVMRDVGVTWSMVTGRRGVLAIVVATIEEGIGLEHRMPIARVNKEGISGRAMIVDRHRESWRRAGHARAYVLNATVTKTTIVWRHISIVVRVVIHLRRRSAVVVGATTTVTTAATRTRREQANRTRVITRALLLGQVVWPREWSLYANLVGSRRRLIREEKFRAVADEFIHDRRITEFRNQAIVALHGCKGQLNLTPIRWLPALPGVAVNEWNHVCRLHEIYKRVANIGSFREVDAQVQKVVFAEDDMIEHRFDFFNLHLVRNVAQHDRGTHLLTDGNFADLDRVDAGNTMAGMLLMVVRICLADSGRPSPRGATRAVVAVRRCCPVDHRR